MRMKILSLPVWVEYDFSPEQEAQALANHSQTLERLNERGGLSWAELAAIMYATPWRNVNKRFTDMAWQINLTQQFGIKVFNHA